MCKKNPLPLHPLPPPSCVCSWQCRQTHLHHSCTYVSRIFYAGCWDSFLAKNTSVIFLDTQVSIKPPHYYDMKFLLSRVPEQTSFGLDVSRTWMFMSLLFIRIYSWGTFENLTRDVCHHLHSENMGSTPRCSTCTCYERKCWFKTLRAQVFYKVSIQKEFLPPPFLLVFCYMILWLQTTHAL